MTDNQRVFIRGVEGRGSEVIAALVNLGAKNNLWSDGDDPCKIYFIAHDGGICYVGADSDYAYTLADFYKEIKLPEQWQDGDILTDCGNDFCVFMGYSEDSPDKFIAYTSLQSRFLLRDDKPLFDKENYRLATQQEIEKFHELLHKLGKDWNVETKRLVDWKWKPKEGEEYFFISNTLEINSFPYNGETFDKELLYIGNCFHTREDAEVMVEKIKKLLNAK